MEINRDNYILPVKLQNRPDLNIILEPVSSNSFLANFNYPDWHGGTFKVVGWIKLP